MVLLYAAVTDAAHWSNPRVLTGLTRRRAAAAARDSDHPTLSGIIAALAPSLCLI
jgi:hypothetical protein